MDLSILEKVNELKEQGRSADDIKHELQAGGVSPENVDQALKEVGIAANQGSTESAAQAMPVAPHHEKVIQPEPGFDPNAK